ncbi:MAG: hypothetical protein HY329_02630 [Chloroflexi bacterium]|nr:hypothetical protein [Chloroflexota bacterium]
MTTIDAPTGPTITLTHGDHRLQFQLPNPITLPFDQDALAVYLTDSLELMNQRAHELTDSRIGMGTALDALGERTIAHHPTFASPITSVLRTLWGGRRYGRF